MFVIFPQQSGLMCDAFKGCDLANMFYSTHIRACLFLYHILHSLLSFDWQNVTESFVNLAKQQSGTQVVNLKVCSSTFKSQTCHPTTWFICRHIWFGFIGCVLFNNKKTHTHTIIAAAKNVWVRQYYKEILILFVSSDTDACLYTRASRGQSSKPTSKDCRLAARCVSPSRFSGRVQASARLQNPEVLRVRRLENVPTVGNDCGRMWQPVQRSAAERLQKLP